MAPNSTHRAALFADDLTGNPSTEDVYLDEGEDVVEYDPMGNRLGSFGVGALSQSHGVAVNDASDDLYASNGAGQVDIFGPGILAAEATTEAATEVTEASATLNGTVNPGGIPVVRVSLNTAQRKAFSQNPWPALQRRERAPAQCRFKPT